MARKCVAAQKQRDKEALRDKTLALWRSQNKTKQNKETLLYVC
jgi:hypothetical protein